jgi:hypothetical protein
MNFTVDNRHLDFNIVNIKYYPSMTYHLEIIGAKKSDEGVDQVGIHDNDLIRGARNTDDDYDDAHLIPESSNISTKTKSLTLHSASNKGEMAVTTMVEKVYNIADIKDSRIFRLESEDSR